jgi:hypothetical protein
MQTQFSLTQARVQGASAAQADFTYSKEQVLARAVTLFRSWSPDQQGGFRVLLATGSASWCYVAECGDEYASA